MELSHYEHNCRLCLKAHNASKNIFNHVIDGCQETLVQIIFSLFKIELHSHNAYPQLICRKCLTEVENILLFKEDLLRNQEYLIGLFKAAYPNYVEKKTCASRNNITSNDGIDLTSQGTSEYLKVAKDFVTPLHQVKLDYDISDENHLTIKNETFQDMPVESTVESHGRLVCKYCAKSFRFERTLQDHYSKAYCLEGTKTKYINANRTTRNSWRNEPLGTDENKNVPFEHLPHQEIEFRQTDINENKPNIDNASISQEENLHGEPAEPTIPQASFLQNLNLITLQDAEILKTQQEPLSKTRPRLVSSKYRVPKTIKTVSVNLSRAKDVHKRKRKSLTFIKKKATKENSPNLLINRSVNFLSRYGCRKFNNTYLKRGKIILKTDKSLSFNQRTKNVNKFGAKLKNSSRDGASSVGPSSLLEKALDKSKAVSKQKGCENESNLDINDSKQDISSLKPKLETIICTKEGSLKNTGTGMQRIDKTVADKLTKKLVSSKTTGKIIVDKPIAKTRLRVARSFPPPSNSPKQDILSGEHESIPPKRFYQYNTAAQNMSRRTGEECPGRIKDLTSSKKIANNLQNDKSRSVKCREANNNDFKIKLVRSSSLDVQSGSDGEGETAIWSIGDTPAPARTSDHKKADFGKSLKIQIDRFPNDLRRSELANKIERSQSLDKFNKPKLVKPRELKKPNARIMSEISKSFNKVEPQPPNKMRPKSATANRLNIMGTLNSAEANSGPSFKRTRASKFESVSSAESHGERADKEQVDLTADLVGVVKCCEVGSVSERKRRGTREFEKIPSIDLTIETTGEVDKINKHADLRKSKRFSSRIGNSHTTTNNITEDRKYNLRRKSESVDIDMVLSLIGYAINDKTKKGGFESLDGMSLIARKKIKQDVSVEHESEKSICQSPIRTNFTNQEIKSSHEASNCELSPIFNAATTSQEAKAEIDSALQPLNDRYQIDKNIGLRMKLRKTSSDSVNCLKYDIEQTEEHGDGLFESQSISSLKESNVHRKKSLVNQRFDKIRNVTVNVDQEFELTFIQADLGEFSGDCPKRNFEVKYEEIPIDSLEKHIVKQEKDDLPSKDVDMPKSSLSCSSQSGHVDSCKRGLSPSFLDGPTQSKRIGRPMKCLPSMRKTNRSKSRLCINPNIIHREDIPQKVPKPYECSIQTRSKDNDVEVVENKIRGRPSKSHATAHKTKSKIGKRNERGYN